MAKKAGMATGVEVARITVKVSPDTREFRRELKRQLEDVEKSAKDKAKTNLDVETKTAEKKVSRSTSKMADTAQKNLSKIKILDGQTDVLRDFAKGMEKFNAANGQAAAFQKSQAAAMRKSMDGSFDLRFDKKVQKFREERFKPFGDFAQTRAETNRIMQEFEITYDKVRRSGENLEIALRPNLKRFDPRVIRAQFRNWFSGKPVEIPVAFGGSGGDKTAANLLSKGGKGTKFPFPSFGSGINPAGWAAILAGVLVAAAPVVGLITTALLALPGLIGLIAAPIAAITLGLDGFKKAAEVIKPQFEELKNIMSQAAETSFTPVMQGLADTIFPLLKESLPRVTQGLADFAQGAIDAFRDPQNAVKFQGALTRIGEAFTAMRPGMDGFISGFIGLIDQFTLKLPAITDWFNKTGTDFDNWVKKISENGDLSTAFDQLGGFIRTVLDLLGQMGGKAIDFMGQKDSVAGFTAAIKEIGNAIQRVIDLSGELNERWQGLVQGTRLLSTINSILQGDGAGAFNNAKDFITNKPWNGAKEQVDELTESLLGAAGQAENAGDKVTTLLGGAGTVPNPVDAAASPIVTPPDLEPAKAEITEYQGFVDDVTQQVRGALSQATSGETLPAPNFDAFKAAWNELPNVVRSASESLKGTATQAVQSVVEVFNSGGALIALTVASWPGRVKEALAPLATAGTEVAAQMVAGMVAGINAGIGSVTAAARSLAASAKAAANAELGIKSPSREFEKIGDYTAQGFAKGMENGFQPVLDQAREMAGKVAEAFANGTDPTDGVAGYSKRDLTRMEKVLSLETKRLESQAKAFDYQAKMTGNEALKARADELRMQKDQISLQKDMLGLTKDYNGEVGSGDDPFAKAAGGLMSAPVDFAKATGKQFLTDLGISGDGFISKAITEGISYVFNIGSVDEALSIKDREDSKQSLAVTGR